MAEGNNAMEKIVSLCKRRGPEKFLPAKSITSYYGRSVIMGRWMVGGLEYGQ